MNRTDRVSVHADDNGTTVVASGALDLHTKGFDDAVKDAALSAESLVVDLRSVTYIDTAILADLAWAGSKMIKRGKRLKVMLTEGSHPLRTIEITGLSAVMDLLIEDEGQDQSP